MLVTLHGGYSAIPKNEKQYIKKTNIAHLPVGRLYDYLFNYHKVSTEYFTSVSKDDVKTFSRRIKFIPNGVCLEFEKLENIDVYKIYDIPKNKKILLNVSRIDKQKNQMFLVKSIQDLSEDYFLVLCGPVTNFEYLNELKAYIHANNLTDRVRFIHDVKPRSRGLRSIYRTAHLFALPSIFEPFGIVILEAWLLGVSVIAADNGGVGALIKTGHGNLFKTNDFDSFKDELTKYESCSSIADYKKRNVDLVKKKYSWETISEIYFNYYLDIIKGE